VQNWLIIGATSGIASQVIRLLAHKKKRLILSGRDMAQIEKIAKDTEIRYNTEVKTKLFNALDFDSHSDFIHEIEESFGKIYGVIWAVGVLGQQDKLENDFKAAKLDHDINYTAAMSFLGEIANYMERRKTGHIVVLGSVAGDRGKASNYIYGAAKAALNTFLQGLRQRLAPAGVKVLTVKPGPVRTRMTDGLEKLPLLANPQDVAKDIVRAIERGSEVLYTPLIWRLIMILIRHVPEKIYKKISL